MSTILNEFIQYKQEQEKARQEQAKIENSGSTDTNNEISGVTNSTTSENSQRDQSKEKQNVQKTMSQQAKGLAKSLIKRPRRAISNLFERYGIPIGILADHAKTKLETIKKEESNLDGKIGSARKNFKENCEDLVNKEMQDMNKFSNTAQNYVHQKASNLANVNKRQLKKNDDKYRGQIHHLSYDSGLEAGGSKSNGESNIYDHPDNAETFDEDSACIAIITEQLQDFINRHGTDEEKNQSSEIFDELKNLFSENPTVDDLYSKLENLCYDSSFSKSLKASMVMNTFVKILLEIIRNETAYDV